MLAILTADLLVMLHFLFIVFVALGGLLALKWPKVALVHIPCALWGVLLEFNAWICPLTPLEVHFRESAGSAGYSGGFIDHYLMPIIYPAGLTQNMQIALGLCVLVVNLLVYAWVFVYRYKRR